MTVPHSRKDKILRPLAQVPVGLFAGARGAFIIAFSVVVVNLILCFFHEMQNVSRPHFHPQQTQQSNLPPP
jgi:hypothetical protein